MGTGSSASQAGIIPGCCILKVGDDEVLKASHDAVVSAVKGSIARSKQEQGKPSVRLKLSYPFLEQLSSFKYECADTSLVEVIERTVESPYTFSVPSQVSSLCPFSLVIMIIAHFVSCIHMIIYKMKLIVSDCSPATEVVFLGG